MSFINNSDDRLRVTTWDHAPMRSREWNAAWNARKHGEWDLGGPLPVVQTTVLHDGDETHVFRCACGGYGLKSFVITPKHPRDAQGRYRALDLPADLHFVGGLCLYQFGLDLPPKPTCPTCGK